MRILNDSTFPDCGETSWRNVLTILLSAYRGGSITPAAINVLKANFATLNPGMDLSKSKTFNEMEKLFNDYPDIANAAVLEAHNDWAKIVANLNVGAEENLNRVQYGRSSGKDGVDNYEIVGSGHNEVKGIVNMLNVVAHFIPDRVINEPWNVDLDRRLNQITAKLGRVIN